MNAILPMSFTGKIIKIVPVVNDQVQITLEAKTSAYAMTSPYVILGLSDAAAHGLSFGEHLRITVDRVPGESP
jgi:hypothetical protein